MRDYDGKTADERVADRRARPIAAGVELFGEHGYAGMSIRSVLRKRDCGTAVSGRVSPIWTDCWVRWMRN